MTAKVKDRPKAGTAYEADYYTWSIEQAALLRAGKLSEIDAEKIAEELDGMGRSEFRVLESALSVLVMHMLKWDQQPQFRTMSWINSIREQRRRIARVIEENPGMKPHLDRSLAKIYPTAVDWASNETHILIEEFPSECPYEWKDVLHRPFEADSVPKRW